MIRRNQVVLDSKNRVYVMSTQQHSVVICLSPDYATTYLNLAELTGLDIETLYVLVMRLKRAKLVEAQKVGRETEIRLAGPLYYPTVRYCM